MRTGGVSGASREPASLARSGGRCDGRSLAISHDGLTGYCSRKGCRARVRQSVSSSRRVCGSQLACDSQPELAKGVTYAESGDEHRQFLLVFAL